MAGESTDTSVEAALREVVSAAGGDSRPDWLATAPVDESLKRRLAALDAALAGSGRTAARAYEAGLDTTERASAGHFRTDPGIAAACCRWAVQPTASGLPRVLDPAVGSGVFADATVDRLGALAPNVPVPDLLERFVGVDLDPVPLALSARRLLARVDDDQYPPLQLYETDFFAVSAGDGDQVRVTDGVTAGRFDAVVGNPPYVRQETADTDRMREHLAAFGPDDETPYYDGERALSRRGDAYVYFVTHATRFLRPGGRLAVVLPTKWLVTRYGGPFQRFLHDHYRVKAVVGFGARAFDDALVDTALLLAERRDPGSTSSRAPVRFVRFDEQVTVETFDAAVGNGTRTAVADVPRGGFAVREHEWGRTVAVGPDRFADPDTPKLGPYLDAPAPLLRLLSADCLVPLGELGSLTRGIMTGANDFFFLDAGGPAREIDDRFLAPAIKSVRDVSRRVITAADTDRYLLDVHDYVADVLAGDPENPTGAVKRALERDGYDGLRAYVARGEREGYHERRSCATRTVWFDLGDPPVPSVFVPKFFDERVLVVANPDGLLASNAIDCLSVAGDARPLLGVLNSTVVKALLECWGRAEGGGALQLMTYELRTLPVPDPRRFDPATREAVVDATDALLAGEAGAQRRLDRAVLDALPVDLTIPALVNCRDRMVRRRRETGKRVTAPIVVPTDGDQSS